jgi:hypothetical protein
MKYPALTVSLVAISSYLMVGYIGYLIGAISATHPAEATHIPAVRVDACPAEKIERELDQCRALTKAQIEILDDDRRLEEAICNRRVESLIRETYPKGSRLVIRSGMHLTGDVGWFVGRGAPEDTCENGSLYSRTDSGKLYLCEGSAWKVK